MHDVLHIQIAEISKVMNVLMIIEFSNFFPCLDLATVVGFLVVGRSFMNPNDARRMEMTHNQIMEVSLLCWNLSCFCDSSFRRAFNVR